MKVKAKLRFLRQSPRKVRVVADMIRGLDITEAEQQLQFTLKRAARPLLKLVRSAVANAEHNNKLRKDNLFIGEIRVDEGPVLKRWRPRAFGRASAIQKKTSHITVVLDERVPTESQKNKQDKTAKKMETKIVKNLSEIKEDENRTETDLTTKSDKGKISEHKDTSAPTGGFKKKFFNRKAG